MSKPLRESDIPSVLADLKARRFFGKLVIEWHAGIPKLMRVEETKIFANGETVTNENRYSK